MSAAPQLIERKVGSLPILTALIATLGLSPAVAQYSSDEPAAVLKPEADAASTAEKPGRKSRVRQSHPPPAEIADLTGLPRVLLIGDHGWGPRSGSNSAGYTLVVRELLRGQANVHRVTETGLHTDKAVDSLEQWLGNKGWDVIHFNFGLHDLKRMDNGQPQVPIEQYEKNLRVIVQQLRQTGASLIWASTTPIPPGIARRKPEDAARYNTVAAGIMVEKGIATNDLYTAVLNNMAEWLLPGSVHTSPQGATGLGQRVAASIELALAKREQLRQK